LIVLLYRAGLRVREALSLLPKDLDPARGTVRILHGKGDRARTVGMDAEAFAVVDAWIERRRRLGLRTDRPLFCTLDGKTMRTAYVRAMLPRIARKAGIEKRVHAHGLRHSHAARLADSGVPIHVIAAQLGHANIGTTHRYVAHLAPTAVVNAVRGVPWGSVTPTASRRAEPASK